MTTHTYFQTQWVKWRLNFVTSLNRNVVLKTQGPWMATHLKNEAPEFTVLLKSIFLSLATPANRVAGKLEILNGAHHVNQSGTAIRHVKNHIGRNIKTLVKRSKAGTIFLCGPRGCALRLDTAS
jgi:hypothetical protein